MPLRLIALLALLLPGCGDSGSSTATTGGALDDDLATLVEDHAVKSIALAVVREGRPFRLGAAGEADADRPATTDTLYLLASVSKPVVGLTAARLMETDPDALDLDADINDVLRWIPPVRHPAHPDTPITLRHLLRHEAGLIANTEADYETYPKPDPAGDLGAFLVPFVARPSSWRPDAPGAKYHYSNVGVALAAHVIEVAADEDFEALCQRLLFDPLGMDDTRWFHGDLSAEQQGRLARPFDEDGEPYEHYGFDDWPSGQLRSTASDMAKLTAMLASGGGDLMSASALDQFHSVPMLIDAEDGHYSHAGGESGANTWLEYDAEGNGYVVLVNSDLEDPALDALLEDVADLVSAL